MSKGKLLEDTFEQLIELGKSTAKKTVKQIGQTLNPLSPLMSPDNNSETKQSSLKNESTKGKNSTPLDFEKLNEKFKNQEKTKEQALRQRLFQMVRQADERLLQEQKQKEIEKKRREELEKQEKERQKKEEQARQQSDIPMGKIRRSIFSPKKVAQRQHIETKASVGKQ